MSGTTGIDIQFHPFILYNIYLWFKPSSVYCTYACKAELYHVGHF